jgi:sugar phosphate isomerase/epimerase
MKNQKVNLSWCFAFVPPPSKLTAVIGLALVILALAFASAGANAGQLPNPFFAMDTGTQDATHQTPAAQVALVKEIGFAGAGPIYHSLAELQAWCVALDQNGLKLFALYVQLPLDDAPACLDSIRKITAVLRGRDTLLWLYVTDKAGQPSGTNDDVVAVNTLREIAGSAKAAGLRVALYPHTGFYVQRVEDAVRLAEKVNLDNLGVTFNLCHWLKLDGKDLAASLDAAKPHLFCVTINGADTGGTSWKELIQPLDRGTFDVSQLLRILQRMNYTGPIGLQHYGIGGNAADNLKHSMHGWERLSAAVLTNRVSI